MVFVPLEFSEALFSMDKKPVLIDHSFIEVIVHGFVPGDDVHTFRLQAFDQPNFIVGLKVIAAFQTLLSDAAPAMRTFLPFFFVDIVAADVNIAKGEQLGNFSENIFQKFEGEIFSHAQGL